MSTLIRDHVWLNPTTLQLHPARKFQTTLTLRDGRRLGYAQYGDPSGKPVFFFHGGAGSRLEHPAHLSALGARIICTDRPGHGLSNFQPDRKLLDWPDDIAQLANHLGINRFYVLGWSAGGPHALACAYQMPKRVIAGAVAASPGPMNQPGATKGLTFPKRAFIFASQNIPWLIGVFRKVASNTIWGDPEEVKQKLLSSFPDDDQGLMLQSGNLDMLFADIQEGYRQGWQGATQDDIVIMQDWGFDIADINVRIDIWHGGQDTNVPVFSGEYLRDRIPNSHASFLPGEGHLFLLNHWSAVVQTLITD